MSAQDWLSQGTLVLASNNKGKIAEFERMFAELKLPVEVIPQGKLNIEDAVEDGLSFVENAIIKARHASKISGKPAIADDSGICVPVLGGAPGIYSARYAGEHGNAVEFGLRYNTADFARQLGEFCVQVFTVAVGVGAVGCLDGKFAHTIERFRHFGDAAFCCLQEGEGIVGIADGHAHAARLCFQASGDGNTRCIILG